MITQAGTRRVVVANVSSPELNHLAAELDMRGALRSYVRRTFRRQSLSQALLTSLPVIGPSVRSLLGRRALPAGLAPERVIAAATASDVIYSLLARRRAGGEASDRWMRRIEASISRRAAGLLRQGDICVSAYYAAGAAFARARDLGAFRVLNYPIAHHRFQTRFYAEERALCGEFGAMLPVGGLRQELQDRLDDEIAAADLILFGSSFARSTFVSEGVHPAKLAVVPYGVDLARFRPPATPRNQADFRAVFVGQVGQRKGVGYLLQAWKQFHGPGTTLTIVGGVNGSSDPLMPYRDLVRWVPNVPQSELPALYHDADVFVFPTLMEGLGLVVVEAMSCGLPVIVTDRGPAEIVRDGIDGFVVPIRDAAAIGEKLELLRGDPDLRRRMGQSAHERAQQFSWARYATHAADTVLHQRRAEA